MAKKTFCRRIKANGIYTGNFNGTVIEIRDRGLYKTEDPEVIAFLEADPEIEKYETTASDTGSDIGRRSRAR